jgi:hypothetical protein
MQIKIEFMNHERVALGMDPIEEPRYFDWPVQEMPEEVKEYVLEKRYAPSAPIGTTDGWPRRRVVRTWDDSLPEPLLRCLLWYNAHMQHGWIANWEKSKRDDPRVQDNPWPST